MENRLELRVDEDELALLEKLEEDFEGDPEDQTVYECLEQISDSAGIPMDVLLQRWNHIQGKDN